MLSAELQLIAIIVGPAGLTGLIIAWIGHRNQRAKPAVLPAEAMTTLAQGIGNQMAMDTLSLRIEKLCLTIDLQTDVMKSLIETLKKNQPKRQH